MCDELVLTILATPVGKEGFVNGYIVETDGRLRGQIYSYGGLSKQRNFDSEKDAIRWLASETVGILGDGSATRVTLTSRDKTNSFVGKLEHVEIERMAKRLLESSDSEWVNFECKMVIVTANKLLENDEVFLELNFSVAREEENYVFIVNSGVSAFEVRYKTAKEATDAMVAFARVMDETDGRTSFDLTLVGDESRTIRGIKVTEETLAKLIDRL